MTSYINLHNMKPGELLEMISNIEEIQAENARFSDLCYLFWMAAEHKDEAKVQAIQYYDFENEEPQIVINNLTERRVGACVKMVDVQYDVARVGTDKIMFITANFNALAGCFPQTQKQALNQDLQQQASDVATMLVMTDSQIRIIEQYNDFVSSDTLDECDAAAEALFENMKAVRQMFADKSFSEPDNDLTPDQLLSRYKDFNFQLGQLGTKLSDHSLDRAENCIISALFMDSVFAKDEKNSSDERVYNNEIMDAEVYLQRAAMLHIRSKKLRGLGKLDF